MTCNTKPEMQRATDDATRNTQCNLPHAIQTQQAARSMPTCSAQHHMCHQTTHGAGSNECGLHACCLPHLSAVLVPAQMWAGRAQPRRRMRQGVLAASCSAEPVPTTLFWIVQCATAGSTNGRAHAVPAPAHAASERRNVQRGRPTGKVHHTTRREGNTWHTAPKHAPMRHATHQMQHATR